MRKFTMVAAIAAAVVSMSAAPASAESFTYVGSGTGGICDNDANVVTAAACPDAVGGTTYTVSVTDFATGFVGYYIDFERTCTAAEGTDPATADDCLDDVRTLQRSHECRTRVITAPATSTRITVSVDSIFEVMLNTIDPANPAYHNPCGPAGTTYAIGTAGTISING